MTADPVYPHLRYAVELEQWLTCEQAAQQFGVLNGCARTLLNDLADACVIRRQYMYAHWYYYRDDVVLVAATLLRRTVLDTHRKGT